MLMGFIITTPYSGVHPITWTWDILRSLFWLLINLIYFLLDAACNVFMYLINGNLMQAFIDTILSTKLFNYSVYLGLLFILLFGAWAILKRNIEPDKAPPLQSIIWEIGKCIVIITIWTFIFQWGFNTALNLQNDIITFSGTSTSNTLASTILLSFIENNENLPNDYIIESLNVDSDTCISSDAYTDGTLIISFWGCSKNWTLTPTLITKFGITSPTSQAPVFLWRQSISASITKSVDVEYDYLLQYNALVLLAGIAFFTVAVIITLVGLCVRLFELGILFVIAPAVIGTSICRQETRQQLWKMLISLILQAAGTLLTFVLTLNFVNTINNLTQPDSFNWLAWIILKLALIIAAALFLLQGSKAIQAFISETSGVDLKSLGSFAMLAAGVRGAFGLGTSAAVLGGAAAGITAKTGAGILNTKKAVNTAIKAHSHAKATGKLKDAKDSEDKDQIAKATAKVDKTSEKFEKAKEKGNPYAKDGTRKANFTNMLSRAGDHLMGKKIDEKDKIQPVTRSINHFKEKSEAKIAENNKAMEEKDHEK